MVVLELVGATLGEAAAFEEACTRRRELSFLVEGPAGSLGVAGLLGVSASGAFWRVSAGPELGAVEGELVCAFTRVRAANKTAPAQIKVLKRLAINMM